MSYLRYNYNENCFDLLTPESLYWLGLLYADGCIFKSKYSNSYITTLSLHNKDGSIVEKFRDFICPQKPIYKPINCAGNVMYSFSFNNKIINNKLLLLGLIPKKSLIIKFPEFLKNHPLVSHFIRGYFDGDGCICEKKHKYKTWLHFTIVGTLDFLQNVNIILERELNIKPRKLIKQGNVYSIHIGKIEYIQKLKNYLYKDAAIYLDRKQKIFYNHSEFKTGTTSKYKQICYRKSTNRWRVTFYQYNQRKEKGFKTELEAIEFKKNLC